MLHAVGNGVVVVFAMHGVVASLADPMHSMDSRVFPDDDAPIGPTSKIPMSMITALHVYHIVRFTLSHADRLHHCLFVPWIVVCGHALAWGALRQLLAFFICGLPGCIDYVQLSHAAPDDAMAVRIRRKYVTMLLNVGLRAPFMCFEAGLHYAAFAHGTTTVPWPCNSLVASLVLVNAMYYTYTSVRSYVLAVASSQPNERPTPTLEPPG